MPQPDAQGPPESIVYDSFDGLKNTVGRERLGPKDLEKAVNIDIDDVGQIRRRRGYTQVLWGDVHSLWEASDATVLGVVNGALSIINPDYSLVALLAGVSGDYVSGAAPVAYCQVGNLVYFSAAGASGIVDLGTKTVSPWGPRQDFWFSPVVNPTATLPAIRGKLLGAPPVANSLAYFNGRIYLAQGRVVWHTELYAYSLIDKTRNYMMFEQDVVMLAAVTDGIYVGTLEGVWFLAAPTRLEPMKRIRVMDSPVVPGSMTVIPSELANPPQIPATADSPVEVSVAFMTTRGFCVGKDSGQTTNLTENKFFFPTAKRSAAMFRRQDGVNQYITVNDAEGQPVNGARIGDYVDATIIRGGASWVEQIETIRLVDSFVAEVV